MRVESEGEGQECGCKGKGADGGMLNWLEKGEGRGDKGVGGV